MIQIQALFCVFSCFHLGWNYVFSFLSLCLAATVMKHVVASQVVSEPIPGEFYSRDVLSISSQH